MAGTGTVKILMCASLFHPVVGGTEGQALALARALGRGGQSVSVVTQRCHQWPTHEVIDGVPVHRKIMTIGRGPLYGLSYLLSLTSFLLRHRRRYQIIHVHHVYLDAFAAGLVGRMLGKPVLAKAACGGDVGDMARLARTRFSALLFTVARRLERVVAISGQIEQELLEHGFDRKRIVRIPNAVDTERYRPTPDRQARKRSLGLSGEIVSFVGRLDQQKGPAILLQAWASVAAQRRDATLLILGSGPQETELKGAVSGTAMTERVLFLGHQPDVTPYLSASDVFVFPSLVEGMPNALLEAMASGLPCVATRIGGNVDLITDGVSGLLVEPADARELADAMLRLLKEPDLAGGLGAAARRTVEGEHSIEAVADRYLKLYQEMLDGLEP